MTPEQIVQALKGMSKEDLRKTAELAARLFTQQAEDIYDQDPENNGRLAQEYSDVAMCMEQAALVGIEPEGDNPVDDPELQGDTVARPTTVTQAVAASSVKDPWGGR